MDFGSFFAENRAENEARVNQNSKAVNHKAKQRAESLYEAILDSGDTSLLPLLHCHVKCSCCCTFVVFECNTKR